MLKSIFHLRLHHSTEGVLKVFLYMLNYFCVLVYETQSASSHSFAEFCLTSKFKHSEILSCITGKNIPHITQIRLFSAKITLHSEGNSVFLRCKNWFAQNICTLNERICCKNHVQCILLART